MNTKDEASAVLKKGTVSATRPGFARVRLPDFDNLRTMWLPVVYGKTQDDKECWTPDIGEQVAVLLDATGEDGVIIGALYSDADAPPTQNKEVWIKRFKDGAVLEYNRETHALTVTGVKAVTVHASGPVDVTAPEVTVTGNVTINGGLRVNGNINSSGSVIDSAGNTNHHRH
ncbi:phage baseplate assembly protein V [Oligella urethralis]|uniref:Baseplate protein n=1 Tax=Oligella urethralis DNF00040 TaxID=1401065 RepID=A0A096AIG4_9BURK|nr:phage baseplate assembly protein V [Oligella urethralis]KGF30497.1 baseplate protein [Oligella urethralis DNF00040]SUA58135.1 Phage P2 baseplate assembly protein gpV [Oligella urethralis]